jgi:hypothetical protein
MSLDQKKEQTQEFALTQFIHSSQALAMKSGDRLTEQ